KSNRTTKISADAACAIHTPHIAKATIMRPVWVTSRIVLRGNRSASDPETGPMASDGKNDMNAAKPSHVVEWVSWKMTNGTAIVCIQEPEFEIRADAQNSK